MSLLRQPIPPKPQAFTPTGAPPGVAVDLQAFRTSLGAPWYPTRPLIRPRLAIIHTNGARREGSLQSAVNWGNASPNNTKPHYNVNAPQPTKHVPTDRRAIANSTGIDLERATGERDVSFWSIAIETADAGTDVSGTAVDLGDFLHDHAEIVARILAYESIVWGFPLTVPDVWNGSGVVTHTEPFPYPHYTTVRGKTCPGTTKKDRVLRGDILPRARQIRAAWVDPTPEPPPEEDDDMSKLALRWKHPDNDAQFLIGQGNITRVTQGMVDEWRRAKVLPELVVERDDKLLEEALRETYGVANDPTE